MMKFISRNILAGLAAILPIVLTLYLLYWFAVTAETALGGMIRLFLPESMYWPGMGLVAALLVVFVLGLLMHAYVFRRLFARGERLLYHMPLIKTVFAVEQEGIRAGRGGEYRRYRDAGDWLCHPGYPGAAAGRFQG
jgi:uncharacterized membrane protein